MVPQAVEFVLAARDAFPDAEYALSPRDAAHPQAARPAAALGVRLVDPDGHPALAALDLSVEAVPGHTEGSLVYDWDRHGGVLLVGDSAMGAADDQGVERVVRPPASFNTDDPALRRWWAEQAPSLRSYTGLGPYHGRPYFDRADLGALAAPTLRPEGTADMRGRAVPA